MTAALVALGSAVGAPARYLLAHHLDARLPWGTWLANLAGSALLGLCVALALDGATLALLGTGFCGGFTTYSAFAVQTARLPLPRAALYAAGTLLGALLACAGGFWVGAQA